MTCEICGCERATLADYDRIPEGEPGDVCWADSGECGQPAIDWRARALEAGAAANRMNDERAQWKWRAEQAEAEVARLTALLRDRDAPYDH